MTTLLLVSAAILLQTYVDDPLSIAALRQFRNRLPRRASDEAAPPITLVELLFGTYLACFNPRP